MSAQGFIGAGDLYIARYVSGVQQGFKGPYEANKFDLTTGADLKRLVSKSKSNYGGVIEAVPIPKPPTFSVEFVRIDKEALLMALLGTEALETQTSGAVLVGAPESVVIPINAPVDAWYPLAHFRVAAFVLKDLANAVTYVAGEDYVVNTETGWVKLLAGGDVVPGGSAITLHASYTYATSSGVKIQGATNAQVRAAFMFDGINLVDSSPCIVNVWEAVLASGGSFDFLANDFNKVTMSGDLKTPLGKSNPFEVVMRAA